MEYTNLGSTGLIVSRLCFGTMTFGRSQWKLGGVDQKTADEMVGSVMDSGINFFDTADIYSAGQSEEMLGRALGQKRRDVVIATKVRGRVGPGHNDAGLSRRHIFDAIDGSLRRLGTDYIDLYQVHGWDALTPLEETMAALGDLVVSGRVRYIGFSNYAAWQAALSIGISERLNTARFQSAQMHYSLLCRDIEHEVVPLCLSKGIGILPWSPLSGGFLSGKYRKDTGPVSGTRIGDRGVWFPPFDRELGFRVVDVLKTLGPQTGATPSQVSLAWLLRKPGVTSVIVGARSMEQLKDNLGAVDVKLDEKVFGRLEELTAPKPMYPNWMIANQSQDRLPKE
ncbi:MAG: aldo/keto reductase [Deltaproteobacteria bacterium]|nr:aldo/keto reductase [Deltaproteobacteria bacterium]MCL5278103.1 aldo/keto reductase [Deltaproteobacteria bacterium]